MDYYHIYVTYCIGTINKDHDITFIQIKNKGYDIGGKICLLDYLYINHIEYDYILFLHSKLDQDMRKMLCESLVKNKNRIELIVNLMKTNKKMYGIFPNWISAEYSYNVRYVEDMLNFLNVTLEDLNFAAGNFMILRKEIINFIFYNRTKMFYNILNEDNSFDINWVRIYYKFNDDMSNDEIYNEYTTKNLYGNNLSIHNKKGDISLDDGMIEHMFERIWIPVIKHLNGDFLIFNIK
jgi:hypothetical protein